ncbi:MAG: hypothetical protein ACJAS1_006595, partial [Oleiphilaceae bacterium]
VRTHCPLRFGSFLKLRILKGFQWIVLTNYYRFYVVELFKKPETEIKILYLVSML